ncbi:MAG: 4Fe-4S binding protein, partial [Candidatus Thalassarchaeaceae archaeon]|nr:4Fe-4S binding protein [Candidatus Thalassarchaeaceae archaeon]
YGEQVINVQTFFDTVLPAYERGDGGATLPADVPIARSLVPAGTAALRDFSHIGPEIPQFFNDNCVGCMTCVVECPDTAILAKVVEEPVLESALPGSNGGRDDLRAQFAHTRKFYDAPAKKGAAPGQFGIFIDPSKCKGCRECVEVCHDLGYDALEMIAKQDDILPRYQQRLDFFRRLPETPERFVEGRVLADLMLAERTLLYVGGAGSCAGCGEATAIRMMLAAGGF